MPYPTDPYRPGAMPDRRQRRQLGPESRGGAAPPGVTPRDPWMGAGGISPADQSPAPIAPLPTTPVVPQPVIQPPVPSPITPQQLTSGGYPSAPPGWGRRPIGPGQNPQPQRRVPPIGRGVVTTYDR